MRLGWEYELVDGVQTGRARPTQFARTMRWQAIPPSHRASLAFTPMVKRSTGR